MSSPVLLVLGAGSRVGASTADFFAAKGFKVVLVSRQIKAEDYPSYLTIAADLADSASVASVFQKVRAKLGEPNVVIYNAVFWVPSSIHEITPDDLKSAFSVNTTNPVIVMQQAIASFAKIPQDGLKVFMFTGNALNERVDPKFWLLGAAKSATAHAITAAAETYPASEARFYYVDERSEEGGPQYGGIDGEAHAKTFWELTQNPSHPPLITFTPTRGIVTFPRP